MVSICPAGGKAAVPLLAEAVPQCWAGAWPRPGVDSVPLFLQCPAFLQRAEQLSGTVQDRPPNAFWPLSACVCCFILLRRNFLGFFSKKVKTYKNCTANKLTLVLSMLHPLKHLKTLDWLQAIIKNSASARHCKWGNLKAGEDSSLLKIRGECLDWFYY